MFYGKALTLIQVQSRTASSRHPVPAPQLKDEVILDDGGDTECGKVLILSGTAGTRTEITHSALPLSLPQCF